VFLFRGNTFSLPFEFFLSFCFPNSFAMRSFGAVQRRRKRDRNGWILPYIPFPAKGKQQYPLICFGYVDRLIGLRVCRLACFFLIYLQAFFHFHFSFETATLLLQLLAIAHLAVLCFFSNRPYPAAQISNEKVLAMMSLPKFISREKISREASQ
jgi:hypothetical protein